MKTDKFQSYLKSAREIEIRCGSLPVRECMNAWGYRSTSATKYTMDLMVEAGLLRRYPRNQRAIYRTIPGA